MSSPTTEKGVHPRTTVIPLSFYTNRKKVGRPSRGDMSPLPRGEDREDGDLLLRGRPSDGRGEQKRLQDFK